MSEEILAVVGFFVLVGLLVSRKAWDEREQAVCGDSSGPRGARFR